jgi:signal transduction histidine kinase
VSGLPLRIRLTAGFAVAMALVLAGAGYLALTRFQETQQEYPDSGEAAAQQGALADLRTELLIALPLVLLVATVGACLQATLERERRLVADASHELRTPLSSLQTELELALRRPRGAAELAAALGSAREETGRLVQLAEDLLLLARSDQADRAEASRAAVPLAPLLGRLVARHGSAVTVDCPFGLSIQADPLQVERAMINLVATATGGTHGAANHPDGGAEVWLTFPSASRDHEGARR